MPKLKLAIKGVSLFGFKQQTSSDTLQPRAKITESRCWNCGEYADLDAEQCPHCGHMPNPYIDRFPAGIHQD